MCSDSRHARGGTWWWAALVVAIAPAVPATHDVGCVPAFADPSTLNTIDLTGAGGSMYYLEERGNPLGTSPPVPFSSFLLGEGTWLWEEQNGVAGAQRGGIGPVEEIICSLLPCLDHEPVSDESCGHGPDKIIF